jgi:hypothetical protein
MKGREMGSEFKQALGKFGMGQTFSGLGVGLLMGRFAGELFPFGKTETLTPALVAAAVIMIVGGILYGSTGTRKLFAIASKSEDK